MLKSFLFLISVLLLKPVFGQVMISGQDPIRDYLRLIEIQGEDVSSPIFYYANQTSLWESDSIDNLGIWSEFLHNFKSKQSREIEVTILSPSIGYGYNSKYPRSYNDGPVWSGRGSTISVNAGIEVKWGPLRGVFNPNYYTTQNKETPLYFYKLDNKSVYSYQFIYSLDLVQLYGDTSWDDFDFGQSSFGIELGNFSAKLSNENLWWGPSISNPILMSNTGPGFLHIDIGTVHPWETKYGK